MFKNSFLYAKFPGHFCCLCLLFLAITSQAQIPDKPNPERFVVDNAKLLDSTFLSDAENYLQGVNDSFSTQIVVVTVPSLGGYEVADYADQLFNKWGIGVKGKNRGVLFLIAANEHKDHISVGYGLEGQLPDVVCKRILADSVRPFFKAGKFDVGVENAIWGIVLAVQNSQQAPTEKEKVLETQNNDDNFLFPEFTHDLNGVITYALIGFVDLLLLLFFGAVGIYMIFYWVHVFRYWFSSSYRAECKKIDKSNGSSSGSGWSSGSSSGSGGGSSSGYGGGSTGGGGASDGW